MDQDTQATEATTEAGEGSTEPKILTNRRQPCPCGSGKKFKNCHEGDPRYEVATEHVTPQAPLAPTPGVANNPKVGAAAKHFPQQQQKSIPSQKSGTTHRRRV